MASFSWSPLVGAPFVSGCGCISECLTLDGVNTNNHKLIHVYLRRDGEFVGFSFASMFALKEHYAVLGKTFESEEKDPHWLIIYA